MASSPAPPTRRLSARQSEVLDALERVFLERGLRSVTLSDLAAEARCSRSTLYDIGAGREQLFLVVLDRFMRRVAARGRDAIAELDDPIDRAAAIATFAAEDLGTLSPAFLDAIAAHPAATRLYERHVTDARDTLERLVRGAIDDGLCRPVHPRVVAETCVVLVLHFTRPGAAGDLGVDPAQALTEALDTVIAGLRSPARAT